MYVKQGVTAGALAQNFIFEYVTNSGSNDMAINATSETAFEWTNNKTNQHAVISRINIVEENQAAAAYPAKFAGLDALASGVLIGVYDADGTTQLLNFTPDPIKAQAEWSSLAGIDNVEDDSAQVDALYIRWTIAKAGSTLILTPGQSIRFTIRDDLSDMERFTAMVQGVYVDDHPITL